MSRTYKATGINLKAMPLGEADRLLTILTREHGLIRVVAPGARKPKSKLGGRSGLFVINELLLIQGRSLDKLLQAETLESFPGLSQDLARLTASQYLAELVLYQALSGQPQNDLFHLLWTHLSQLEQAAGTAILAALTQATLQILTLAGIDPQLQTCSLTQVFLDPEARDSDWRAGFSFTAGGVVDPLSPAVLHPELSSQTNLTSDPGWRVAEVADSKYGVATPDPGLEPLEPLVWLSAAELSLLQRLDRSVGFLPPNQGAAEIMAELANAYPLAVWLAVERVLRQYVQYHFNRPIRAATLVETCFCPLPHAS